MIREVGLVNEYGDDEFTRRIRDALLGNPRLVRLLRGAHVLEESESPPEAPHITIGQTKVLDCPAYHEIKGQRTVTLQIWPKTGDMLVAQELLSATHHALETGGFLNGQTPIQLSSEFSGSRRLPESKEIQGLLRYHAVRCNEAA
jgi:hypothetical protein